MCNRWSRILAAPLVVLVTVAGYRYLAKPRIDRSQVYKIGFGNDRHLHFSDSNGNPSGLAVGSVREAARRRGIRLAWVTSKTPGISAAHTGEVDFWVMAADLPERHKLAYLTEPYLVTEYCLLVPAESPDRKAADLATARISYAGFSAERLNGPAALPQGPPDHLRIPWRSIRRTDPRRVRRGVPRSISAGDLVLSGDW